MTSSIREALEEIRAGSAPRGVAVRLLEASVGRPPTSMGAAIRKAAGTAYTGWAAIKLLQHASQAAGPLEASGRIIQSLLGSSVAAASRILAHQVTGATVNVLGGPERVAGKGSGVTYTLGFNVPPAGITREVVLPGRGGRSYGGPPIGSDDYSSDRSRGGRLIRTTFPVGEQPQFARFEADPTADGYVMNLYRQDPSTGLTLGAPLKTFTARFTGLQPANLRRMEDSLARTIADVGQALLTNRAPRPRPPLVVQRRPGRPPNRAYAQP